MQNKFKIQQKQGLHQDKRMNSICYKGKFFAHREAIFCTGSSDWFLITVINAKYIYANSTKVKRFKTCGRYLGLDDQPGKTSLSV